MSWTASPEPGVRYRVLRNTRSAPDYETVCDGADGLSCVDASVDFSQEDYVTYKVVAVGKDGAESAGALHTCSRATPREKEAYVRALRERNQLKCDPARLD